MIFYSKNSIIVSILILSVFCASLSLYLILVPPTTMRIRDDYYDTHHPRNIAVITINQTRPDHNSSTSTLPPDLALPKNSELQDRKMFASQDRKYRAAVDKESSEFLNYEHADARPGSLHKTLLPFEHIGTSRRKDVLEAGRHWTDQDSYNAKVRDETPREWNNPKDEETFRLLHPDDGMMRAILKIQQHEHGEMIKLGRYRLRQSVKRKLIKGLPLGQVIEQDINVGRELVGENVQQMPSHYPSSSSSAPSSQQQQHDEKAKNASSTAIEHKTDGGGGGDVRSIGNDQPISDPLLDANQNVISPQSANNNQMNDVQKRMALALMARNAVEKARQEADLKSKGWRLSSNGDVAGAQQQLLKGNPDAGKK